MPFPESQIVSLACSGYIDVNYPHLGREGL